MTKVTLKLGMQSHSGVKLGIAYKSDTVMQCDTFNIIYISLFTSVFFVLINTHGYKTS